MSHRKIVFEKSGRICSRKKNLKWGSLRQALRQFDHLCLEAARATVRELPVMPEAADLTVAGVLTEARKGLVLESRVLAAATTASAVRKAKNAKAELALARGIEAQAERQARQAQAAVFGDRRSAGVVVRKAGKQPVLVAAAQAAEAALAVARQGVTAAQSALVGVVNPSQAIWANPLAARPNP